ncbi:52 kDa repressor of the inhibitor of the protein kinase-like [Hydra vulgaris]|uniref:52 kDa repressor of the inhibitor of the protein kinase-like n=1 Tax=Hydra vulgaris TaxID=6087 RepID=UPI0032EA8908
MPDHVISESINIATNFSYSSFLTLCALSSVVGIPIESYYPIEKDRKEIEKTVYEILFNCTVRPRVEHSLSTSVKKIHILRCSSVIAGFKQTSNIFINKDHFVPLISLKCIPKKYQAPNIFAPKVVKLPEINQLLRNLSPFPTDKKICVVSSAIKLKSSTTLSIAECSSKYIHSPIKANLNSKSSSSAFGNKCELSFVNKYDIGLYETYGINKLGNEDKYDLLKNFTRLHQTATLKATHFRQCMEQKINFIDLNLNKVIDEQVKKNREILTPIVLAIIMCGKQNIPLRGHRDDSFYYENENSNSGNLQSILKLISDCASRSNSANEASDVSNMERMPLVLRFVNDNCEICELFFGFIPCDSGLSGEAIGSQILNSIKDLGLEMKFCVGQGYDGAGNMAWNCSGAAVRKAIYPKALYVHCGSHVLNLCVANACNIQIVSNMMSNIRVISQFFNFSPKRFDVLKKKIEEMFPKAHHSRLIDVCRTRWIARIDGLDVFIEFLVTLVVVSRCLEVTRPITKQFQSPNFDVFASHEKINLLHLALQRLRSDIEHSHGAWYSEAVVLGASVGVYKHKPRTIGKQLNRNNCPSESINEYYKKVITIPFLDHLSSQIQLRFCNKNIAVYNGFFAMPTNVLNIAEWRSNFLLFSNEYEDELPEPRYIMTELNMWEDYWRSFKNSLPTILTKLLPLIDRITFPNIFTLIQILATIPVTTCTCERSIFVIRRLKTYLRSTDPI